GNGESRRQRPALLALRRRPRPDAVAAERPRPAVRQRLFRVCHGVRADGRRGRPRADRHRPLPERQRPLRPAPRTGARVRHVRRARRDDADLHPAAADLVAVAAMRPRRFISPSAVIWLLIGAAYFLIPLIATFLFSMRHEATGKCCTLGNYGTILHDPSFWKNIKTSFILSLETIGISLLLLVPTAYWVNLKRPKLRTVIGFLALVPFVVPPIILVVGLLDVYRPHTGALGFVSPTWFYAQPYGFLVAAYVILAFPYVYFALDAG